MKTYCWTSGALFAIVSVGHILRIVNHWDLIIGPWSAPMAVSWGGAIVPAVLSTWAFNLTRT